MYAANPARRVVKKLIEKRMLANRPARNLEDLQRRVRELTAKAPPHLLTLHLPPKSALAAVLHMLKQLYDAPRGMVAVDVGGRIVRDENNGAKLFPTKKE